MHGIESRGLYCFGQDQVFVGLNGSLTACCIGDRTWYEPGASLDDLWSRKEQSNRDIYAGDCSSCKLAGSCDATYERGGVGHFHATKIVVWTNTLCPLQCKYCFQAWPDEDSDVPPVRQAGNYIQDLGQLLDRMLAAPGSECVRNVELSGGDSAFHPEFCDILDMLADRGVQATYLSSGIVPKKVMPKLIEKMERGDLTVSVSPDAATAATWSRVTRRPQREFAKVVEFVRAMADAQTLTDQLWLKFIVLTCNAHEIPAFIEDFYGVGVRSFCFSEYRRAQIQDRTKAMAGDDPDLAVVGEADLGRATLAAKRAFLELPRDHDIRLDLIGLERFNDDQNCVQLAGAPGSVETRTANKLALGERLVRRGEEAYRSGRGDSAVRLFRRATEYVRHPVAFNDMAVVLLERGDTKAAARSIGEALQVAPDDPVVRETAKAVVAAARNES